MDSNNHCRCYSKVLLLLRGVDNRRVIRVRVCIEVDIPHIHVIEKLALLINYMLIKSFSDFINEFWKNFNKSVAASVLEVKFKMTVSRQHVHVWCAGASQISCPKDWKLDFLLVEVCNWNIERSELLVWFFIDEDDAVIGQVALNKNSNTVPLADFFPMPSIAIVN